MVLISPGLYIYRILKCFYIGRGLSTILFIRGSFAQKVVSDTAVCHHMNFDNQKILSHKMFFNKCIEEKVIPEGLMLHLEPSVGNHDE